MLDKKASNFEVQTLSGKHGRKYSRHKCEGVSYYPGRSCDFRMETEPEGKVNRKKSAEGIVG